VLQYHEKWLRLGCVWGIALSISVYCSPDINLCYRLICQVSSDIEANFNAAMNSREMVSDADSIMIVINSLLLAVFGIGLYGMPGGIRIKRRRLQVLV
jgi:hypothetical protein